MYTSPAVVPSGAVSYDPAVEMGTVAKAAAAVGRIKDLAVAAGWSSSIITGGYSVTSVATPGLGDQITLKLTSTALSGVCDIQPVIAGHNCPDPGFNPFDFDQLYSIWFSEFQFACAQGVASTGGGGGIKRIMCGALYVPPEQRANVTNAIFSVYRMTNLYTGRINNTTANIFLATYVNGVFKTDPWVSTRNGLVAIEFPCIFNGAALSDTISTNGRDIAQVPYVSLCSVDDTEARIAGYLCDSFISLKDRPSNSLATLADGRTYVRWQFGGGIGNSDLWLAIN